VIDDKQRGKSFFGFVVKGTESVHDLGWDMILLTQLDNVEEIIGKLNQLGIGPDKITAI
jgi:hypothetical protein